MDEDRLRSLMESPLEDGRRDRSRRRQPRPPRPDRPGGAPGWGPLLGALAIGGALVLGGYAIAGDSPAEPVEPVGATTLPTTPPTTAPPSFGGLPAGYTAINDRVGARPERVLVREGTMFVSFTTAVRSALDPDETSGFTGGRWSARLGDGRTVPAIGEFTDPFARGTFTLAFTLDGFDAGEVETIELTGEAVRAGTSHTSIIQIEDGLPWSGVPERTTVQLESGLTFVIDSVDLASDGGELAWHVEGPDDRVAVANASIILTADADFPAGFMFHRQTGGVLAIFGSAVPPPSLGRAAVIPLEAERVGRPSTVRRIVIDWTIDWFSYVPAASSMPLEGVPVVTVGG